MKGYDKEKSVWRRMNEEQREAVHAYGERYKAFLDTARTERLAVKELIRQAEAEGFKPLEAYTELKAGDKVYWNQKGKSLILGVVGARPITDGLKIVGAHVDSPRLDAKGNAVVEKNGIVYLKTHYYGGIKKYQWVCQPLSLIGVAHKADGTAVEISIGEDPADPALYITDILPHLGKDQAEKKVGEAIEGEMLMPLLGLYSEEEKTKPAILALLKEKYDLEEEDLVTAELEVIPAQKARDVGLDRSMIAAHGHDDRVCAYAAWEALKTAQPGEYMQIAVFADKEEIGSYGNTGMSASYFLDFLAECLHLAGQDGEIWLRRTLRRSEVLSADVTAALDPNFASVHDPENVAYLGFGPAICKYTGARGKSGSNDANAEFIAKVRRIFNTAQVPWQISELGKVDQGGGGTIAFIMAQWGCEVVDCGTAMLSMHAPVEIVAKTDAYTTSLAYKAFFESN